MTLNSNRHSKARFPTDLDIMHCEKHSWENQQELSPNKEHHQQDFPNKLLVQDQIYDKAIGSSQGQRTDTHTHWLDNTEKTRLRQESKSSRPAPSKGIASKNRKKSQRMNFSLHLPTSFTFIRQHKATPKGKKTIHIYKNCTRHLLGMHLNSTVALRGWKVYWKHSPCTYTYIHISRAVKLPNVANICLLPFHVVVTALVWNMRSQPSHFYGLAQPVRSLVSGCL